MKPPKLNKYSLLELPVHNMKKMGEARMITPYKSYREGIENVKRRSINPILIRPTEEARAFVKAWNEQYKKHDFTLNNLPKLEKL